MPDRAYQNAPSLKAFHVSDGFVRGIVGPIGSGKSVACVMEIMRRAAQQRPSTDGIRRTRWAVIRNTYGELRDTTLKTFFDWVPNTGNSFPRKWNASDYVYHIRQNDLDAEILFRALDRPQQIKKLLSLELTGAWVNEAREVPLTVVNALQGRVGRFPSARDEGCSWFGVLMDTNAPDTDHWWYRLFEEERPENWLLVRQPPGRSREAENIANLPPRYYDNLVPGKSPDWINVYVDGQYGFVREGKPVWGEYSDRVHCAAEPLGFDAARPLLMGQDFGLTPAAVFAQRDVQGRWRVLEELIGDGMGIQRFAEIARGFIAEKFPGVAQQDVRLWGDPAGADPAQTDERTCFQILRAQGFQPERAPTQNFAARREAVAAALNRLIDGEPGFLLSPSCRVLRKALGGGYAYRRIPIVGDERFAERPDKNRYSHPADALQYLMCGGGEAHQLVQKKQPREEAWDPVKAARRKGGYGGGEGPSWVGTG
jgi:hypothetical protein